jgi:hypothetical protein
MTKKTATAKQVAKILRNTALTVTPRQFEAIAAYARQDNSPTEIAAVAQHMPPGLQNLMPRKWLH